jgi:hypothetical protein
MTFEHSHVIPSGIKQSYKPKNVSNLIFISQLQYHGGTNFGRSTGGPFISTSYDYDAPLDEYGMSFIYLLA